MACFRSTLNGHRQIANHEQRTCEFFRRIIAENVLCVYVCAREKWKLKGHAKINRSRMAWHTACVTKNERNEKKFCFFFFLSHTRNAKWEPKWKLGEPALKSQLTDVCAFLLVCKLFFIYIYRIEKIDWTFFCSLFHCPRTTLTPCLALSFFLSFRWCHRLRFRCFPLKFVNVDFCASFSNVSLLPSNNNFQFDK